MKAWGIWLMIGIAGVAIAALAIPGSPVHLTNFLVSSKNYRGRSVSSWAAGLQNADAKVRSEAMHALGMFGADAREAVPALVAIMRTDPEALARLQAAQALSKMAPATAEAALALGEALSDEELAVRMHAAVALFRLGKDARPAAPALLKALKDKNNDTNLKAFHFTIQEMTALALGRATAGSDDAVPGLTEALDAADWIDTRIAIARALGEIGPAALPAAASLRKQLGHKHSTVREAAQEALEKIGVAAEPQDNKGAELQFVPRPGEVIPLGPGARLPALPPAPRVSMTNDLLLPKGHELEDALDAALAAGH